MTESANKQIVRDFYASAARGDLDASFALVADDVVWNNIGSTRFSGSYRGKQTLIENLLGPLFGALKNGIAMRVDDLIAEGDLVAVLATGSAETHAGVPYNNSYCQVFRIRGGLIAEVREYMDTALVDRVFGPRDG